ncbi:MAG: hypothetical protein J1D77_03240 [Muribaculaceae bacterium]|nr:hypothetical protein [Muribaculaceae bacterium]
MLKRYIFLIFTALIITTVKGQDLETVTRFGNILSNWSISSSPDLMQLQELCSNDPSFRAASGFIQNLAQKNNLAITESYDLANFITCLQKEIDAGNSMIISGFSYVPEEYVEFSYPGVVYVSANVKFIGQPDYNRKDLFILKGGKIAKISDYLEYTDSVTGELRIDQDLLELARYAFLEGDYLKCYDYYKNGGLKDIKKRIKENGFATIAEKPAIIPYVESCFALNKWTEAWHGIIDDDMITHRKTWVNGKEWTLDAKDLETWNPDKASLLNYILEKFEDYYYAGNSNLKQKSPIFQHAEKMNSLSRGKSKVIKPESSHPIWEEGMEMINKASENNDGKAYNDGIVFLEAAIKKIGKTPGRCRDLGDLCGSYVLLNGYFIRFDEKRAEKWWKEGAKLGDIYCSLRLYKIYKPESFPGIGAPQKEIKEYYKARDKCWEYAAIALEAEIPENFDDFETLADAASFTGNKRLSDIYKAKAEERASNR